MKAKVKTKAKARGKSARSGSESSKRRWGATALLSEALRLPVNERAEIAGQLLRSLDEDEQALSCEEYETAWEQEIARRLKDVDEGNVETAPWKEARHRIVSDDDLPPR